MKNIQKLMLMTFMMVASSAILQAATTCTIQMKNSTGYTMLQSGGGTGGATQIPNGATFNYAATLISGQYMAPFGNIRLFLRDFSGGAANYDIPNQNLGTKTCSSSTVYNITLNQNNKIKIAAAA